MSTPNYPLESLGARLRHAIEIHGWTIAELSRRTKIPYPSLRDYLSDEKRPGADALAAIQGAGISVDWLLSGAGEVFPGKTTKVLGLRVGAAGVAPFDATIDPELLEAGDGREFVLLPRMEARVGAGEGTIVNSDQIVDHYAFSMQWFSSKVGIPPRQAVLVEVHGDSMRPVLEDGDLVIIDKGCNTLRDDAIYVLQYGGGLRIKSVRRKVDGRVEIRSANQDYGVELLTEQEAESGNITIVGRARWALSGRRLP